ncbi:hypothetical protein GCM10023097_68300 [Streptomyces collinus]
MPSLVSGVRPLGSFRPVHIREFVRDLENDSIGGTYARNIYANVRAVLSAAVDDGHLARNPCSAASVRPPAVSTARVVPWLPSQVRAVRDALPERYQAMVDVGSGCGHRQGEIIGLAEDTLQLDSDTLRVTAQDRLAKQLQHPGVEARPCGRRPYSDSRTGQAVRLCPAARNACPPPLLRLGPPGRGREHQGRERIPGPLRPGDDAAGVRA